MVVEDDALSRDLIRAALPGVQVHEAGKATTALNLVRSLPLNLMILDLGLPGTSGLEVLEALRRFSDLPVIVVTGDVRSESCVRALKLGADDYVVKPFDLSELQARVEAVLRRHGQVADVDAGDVIVADGLTIDLRAGSVEVDGVPIALAPREYDLLTHLASHPRRVFGRQQLLEVVWDDYHGELTENTVTEHIRKLRRKLEQHGADHHLVTVQGMGYRFDP